MKERLQTLYNWFIGLKVRPWTHVLAFGANGLLLCYMGIILIGLFQSGINDPDITICIDLLTMIYFLFNYTLLFLIGFIFIIEIITLFKLKIKNKFLLTNPVYHVFWITGFVIYIIALICEEKIL